MAIPHAERDSNCTQHAHPCREGSALPDPKNWEVKAPCSVSEVTGGQVLDIILDINMSL